MPFETIDIFLVNDNCSDRELRNSISNYPNIKIVGEANHRDREIQKLKDLLKRGIKIDLIILLCSDRASFVDGKSAFDLYQKLIDIDPNLPIFILTGKDSSQQFIKVITNLDKQENKDLENLTIKPVSKGKFLGKSVLKKILKSNARSGLDRIANDLNIINNRLGIIQADLDRTNRKIQNNSQLFFDLLFWQGRRRELLVSKLLLEQVVSLTSDRPSQKKDILNSDSYLVTQNKNMENGELINKIAQDKESTENGDRQTKNSDLEPISKYDLQQFNCVLLAKIAESIGIDLENNTGLLLEIDILKPERKIELIQRILQQLDKIYIREKQSQSHSNETSQSQTGDRTKIIKKGTNQKNQLILSETSSLENQNLLLEIWQESTKELLKEYLGENLENYDTLEIGEEFENEAESILNRIIVEETANVQQEIFSKNLLFEEAFISLIKGTETSQFILDKKNKTEIEKISGDRAIEIVIQNSIVKIANAAMVVVLNNFVKIECIEKNLYKTSLLSSREMAKFRNRLSWRYRKEKYIQEPKDIFESQYRLYYFSNNKICTEWFYKPRHEELNQLRGIPWLTTIAIETRDSLAPILQAIVGFVGEAIFYFLKDVVGKGIGLIAQGVIQGIGNALQDNRYSKNNKRTK